MNTLLGVLIIFGLIFFLAKFTGFLGEKLVVLLMALFIITLFFLTVGYAFM